MSEDNVTSNQNEKVNALVVELISMLSRTELIYVAEKLQAAAIAQENGSGAHKAPEPGVSKEVIKQIRDQFQSGVRR